MCSDEGAAEGSTSSTGYATILVGRGAPGLGSGTQLVPLLVIEAVQREALAFGRCEPRCVRRSTG